MEEWNNFCGKKGPKFLFDEITIRSCNDGARGFSILLSYIVNFKIHKRKDLSPNELFGYDKNFNAKIVKKI